MSHRVPSAGSQPGQSIATTDKTSPQPGGTGTGGDSAAIVRAFNTWAFKREQPSSLAGLEAVAAAAAARQSPVPFVLYWGKGPRNHIAGPERECLGYLEAMAQKIEGVYPPGALLHLVFTDTHARFNGHDQSACDAYFGEVLGAASRRCYGHRLSELVAGLAAPDAAVAEPAPHLLEALVQSAAKWHRGGLPPEAAARTYYAMNLVEQVAIARAFPDATFVTFNDSRFRPLFPGEMPVFYMYSLRKGIAVKPWFLPAETAPADAAAKDAAA